MLLMDDFFGGALSPIGWMVQFIEQPVEVVGARLVELRRRAGQSVGVTVGIEIHEALQGLLPFELPWSREVLFECGSWTAYLNNGLFGGDSTALGPALGRSLGTRCVVARHTPRYGPGHQSTQLEVLGPGGQPPLMYQRSISATAADGRWGWFVSGQPLPFEDTGRYRARRVADRLDRPLLVRYLAQLGIPVDDDLTGTPAQVFQQQLAAGLAPRTVSLDEARTWVSG